MTGKARIKKIGCLLFIILFTCIICGLASTNDDEALLLVEAFDAAIGMSGDAHAGDNDSQAFPDADNDTEESRHTHEEKPDLSDDEQNEQDEPLGSSGEHENSEDFPPVQAEILPEAITIDELGNWTNYNGLIFANADIYDSQSGGGLAVGGRLSFHTDIRIGSTHTSEYDPTLHIGEYQNLAEVPALLFGSGPLVVDASVTYLDVYGGVVAMTEEMIAYNNSLDVGITPRTDSAFQSASESLLWDWFTQQHKIAIATSELMLLANDVTIELAELGDGSYMADGSERFKNQYFKVNGEVYENALFVTVRTDSQVDFGQWWPVMSLITIDVDWAIDYDLLVFSFPDAINVTMNSSTFSINTEHWSTTVDAWLGERGTLERHALAEKVVYNFPNAGSVQASEALIQGSILAPKATFTGIGQGSNGHIYGHIVAKNYIARGNFTIHAFELTHWIYDIVQDEISSHGETGAINLRHYLYFRGEPTSIRTSGGEFVLESEDGTFYNGRGGFTQDIDDAAVYGTLPEQYTLIQDIPLGNYTLINSKAPEGFSINLSNMGNGSTFYRYPVSVLAEGQTVHAVRYSEPDLIDIAFQKVDSSTGEGLQGAVFTLVREADEYQDSTIGGTFTSDENGSFTCSNVPTGRYHLVEVSTPDGYELIPGGEFAFTVEWDAEMGWLVVRDAGDNLYLGEESNPVPILNEAGTSQNAIVIIKYVEDPDEPDVFHPLPGASFSMFRYNEELDTWEVVTQNATGGSFDIETNEYGYYRVENLAMGYYRIAETKAPDGYSLSNRYADLEHEDIFPYGFAYEFSFTGETSFYTAYIPGTALEMDVAVSSVGSPFGDDLPLAGTSFRLERLLSDGITWEELVYAVTTGTDGLVAFTSLETGVYRLTCLSPTTGYHVLEPSTILFSIAFNESGAPEFQAFYNSEVLTPDTYPIWLDFSDGTTIVIKSEARTSGYLVYKADGEVQAGTDEQGAPIYLATYLEGAEFRLRRRTNTRESWQDYSSSFTSELLYDENDLPVTDGYGNHIAAAIFPHGLIYGEYQLVEMTPPAGYQPGSDILVTFDDGETGFQLHLFTIALGMTGGGQTATYTAFDYPIQYTSSFRFRTVDSTNHQAPVSGAEFALYYCPEEHAHDEFLTEDSCWVTSTPINEISNPDGVVIFEELISGSYLLRENLAPGGYQLPNTYWLVTVNAKTGSIAVSATNSASYDFIPTDHHDVDWLLPNRKQTILPITGGAGTTAFIIIGGLLIASAVVYFIRNQFQIKPGNEE